MWGKSLCAGECGLRWLVVNATRHRLFEDLFTIELIFWSLRFWDFGLFNILRHYRKGRAFPFWWWLFTSRLDIKHFIEIELYEHLLIIIINEQKGVPGGPRPNSRDLGWTPNNWEPDLVAWDCLPLKNVAWGKCADRLERYNFVQPTTQQQYQDQTDAEGPGL